MDIYGFWRDVLGQDAERIRGYFREDAYVNCDYPGEWEGEVERVEERNDLTITVTHVYPKDRSLSFHVTSFFQIPDGRIQSLDEYWADDGTAPDWRLEKKIGTKIR